VETPTKDLNSPTSYLDFAKSILRAESEAIEKVAAQLDQTFTLAVHEISNISPVSKLIVTGMGKAGFIAMKISATFASIGLPSFYLHPAEAIHGDLGRFTKNDIVLVLSNSGETPEILRILPHLKLVGCPVIGITAERESTLSSQSDIAVCYGKHAEVEPLKVAPTVSTTIMLAVGDALAMAVAHKRGINHEDFARFHPGGALGKSLTLVSKVMRQGPRHCVVKDDTLVRDVIRIMIETPGRPGAATVVDQQGRLKGILTDGNVRRCLSHGAEFLEQPVSLVMGSNPKTVSSNRLIEEALHIISEFAIDELVVVDADGLPVGQIDIQDIIALQTS
jgi:arabinose-5-phosphate isomerase